MPHNEHNNEPAPALSGRIVSPVDGRLWQAEDAGSNPVTQTTFRAAFQGRSR